MAKLTENPYPLPEISDFDSYDEYNEAEKAALDKIDEPIIRFHVADNYACYRVVEMDGPNGEPLLQHIPSGDGYRIPAAHIRGLRKEDVEQKIAQQEKLKEFFS